MCDTLAVQLIGTEKGIDYVTLVSLFIGVAGFVFGGYQFFVNRRGKRIEYLDSLMKRFREEPLLKSSMMLLDWEYRTIKIGERQVDYKIEMLSHALADHKTFKDPLTEGFTEDEASIRDAYDAMFDFCSSIEYSIQLRMVKHKDIFSSPLAYYLSKIFEKDRMSNGAVFNYIRAYGFIKTEKLLREYQTWVEKQRV
jgi:hypothetical protein